LIKFWHTSNRPSPASFIWEHFILSSNKLNEYACVICGKTYFVTNSVDTLKKHLSLKHKVLSGKQALRKKVAK
jgi:hypothetical protein